MESPYSAVQYRDGNASLASTIALQQAQHVVSSQGFMITSEEQLRREKRRQKKWTVLIALISMIGFFVALSAVIIEASTVVYIAFVFPLVLGPYAIHQRRKLNKLPSLIFVMNQIRDQINRIMVENSKLNIENTRLENEIHRLNDYETKLGTVIQKSGHDVDTIVSLVKENAEIQRQMKKLLNAQELQSLLQAILQSDSNSDHIVSSQEIERLLIRLQTFSMVDTMKMKMVLQNFVGQNTSTTTLYNHLALSQDEDDDEVDFSLGYGDWLFEEA